MKILNEDEADSERRIDMLSKTKYNDTVIEVCSTEFKRLTAFTTICNRQQSKNIRISSAIAYNIHNITKKELAIEYMDWRGRIGCGATIFFYEDGQENVYNDLGIKVFDPMEDALTQITGPNVVLEIIATQSSYLEAHKSIEEKNVKKSRHETKIEAEYV